MKKNLVSLGILDSLGFEYSGEGGVIRGKEGSLVVIKGNMVDDIYFLKGRMVTDSANVSSSNNFRLLAVLAQQSEEQERFMSHIPYSSVFGSITCVMVCFCPNVSHAVSVVSLGTVHWQAIKL